MTTMPQQIAFNVDTHKSREFPPFTVLIGDRPITLLNPRTMDWKAIVGLETNADLVRKIVPSEDWDFFRRQTIPADTMNQMLEAYYRHFEMDPKDPANLV